MSRRVICITGMHRSGTSAASRVVNLLGVSLGRDSDLLAALPDNPRGFWENISMTRFAERVLHTLGGSWDDPPVLADGWEQHIALDKTRRDAAAVVHPLLHSGTIVGWKDPRSSIVLPFWRAVVPIDCTVMMIRDPKAVAGSLAKRNGISAERAAYLWLRYNVAAWRNDARRLPVSYADLLTSPEETIELLARAIGTPVPEPGRLAAIAGEVTPELGHSYDVPVGPTMRLAGQYFDVCACGSHAEVDRATEELHQRWLEVGKRDARLRALRRSVRRIVPSPVRRRLRSHVGGLVSAPVRMTSASHEPLVSGGGSSATGASWPEQV